MAIRLPNATRTAAATAVTDRVDGGSGAGLLRIYTGSQPASANDSATGTLLAEVVLEDPAFTSGGNGVRTLADPGPVTGSDDGNAGWFRITDSTGATVLDGSAGGSGSGADLILSNVSIASGQTVDIEAGGTVTMPSGE